MTVVSSVGHLKSNTFLTEYFSKDDAINRIQRVVRTENGIKSGGSYEQTALMGHDGKETLGI